MNIKDFNLGYDIGYGYSKNQLKSLGESNFLNNATPVRSNKISVIVEKIAEDEFKIITSFPSMK